jgi:hypothetical protein
VQRLIGISEQAVQRLVYEANGTKRYPIDIHWPSSLP